jgi:hypothetical protein
VENDIIIQNFTAISSSISSSKGYLIVSLNGKTENEPITPATPNVINGFIPRLKERLPT